jgi:hypothetical protein
MADIIRIQDMKAEEIAALLTTKGRRLSSDEKAAVRDSANEISRMKKAYDALETLGTIRDAA